MSAFRKKPVVIEAVQMPTEFDQDAVRLVAEWMVDNGYEVDDEIQDDYDPMYIYGNKLLPDYGTNFLHIETLEGEMQAGIGDWIIRGVKGEFYPCKPDIFAETYESVAEATS